jgi:uncharacterized repeat protein (TIGR03803 family)
MKRTPILLVCIFLILNHSISAQERLYGVTEDGGINDKGTIFSFDVPSNRYTCLFKFSGPDGANPVGSLIQATDEKFYGVARDGGSQAKGTLFSYDPVRNTTQVLVHFGAGKGNFPGGGLMQASDGKLYGTTDSGGVNNNGVIYSYDPASSTFQKRLDFPAPGPAMDGKLMQVADGRLFGLHRKRNGIFSFDPNTNQYQLLREFASTEGSEPQGSLLLGADNKLYGLARSGGTYGFGTLFSYDPANGNFNVGYHFDKTNGAYPVGDLIGKNSEVRGLTSQGGNNDAGVLFSYNFLSSSFSKLHDFSMSDGKYPVGGLLYNGVQSGEFGMTSFGGAFNKGTIFKYGLNRDNCCIYQFQKLHDLNGLLGSSPRGSLMNLKVYHWGGYFSPAWYDPNNWGTEVPPPGASISIAPGADFLFLDKDRTVGNILWDEDSDIHLNGNTLTVNGSLIGRGYFLGDPHNYDDNSGYPAVYGSGLVFTGPGDTLNMYNGPDGFFGSLRAKGLRHLTLTSGARLTLGSAVDIYETLKLTNATLDLNYKSLTLRSTPTTTARIDDLTGSTLSNATNVTVERYIPNTGRRWRLLTAPLNNLTINTAWQNGQKWNGVTLLNGSDSGTLITGQQQGSAANANSRGFDFWSAISNSSASLMSYTQRAGQGVWSALPNTTTPNAFNNDQAYLLFVRGPRSSTYSTGTANAATTLRPTGTIKQGDRNIWIDGTKGYTLIGNPYPSQIDFNSIYTNNGNASVIKRQLWLWDATTGNTGNFIAVIYSSGKYVEVPVKFHAPGQASPLTTIQSGQGFFVLPLTTAGGTLKIREYNKTAALPAQPNILLSDDNTARVYLNLLKAGPDGQNVTADGIMAAYGNDYRMQTTDEEDVRKFENLAENLAIRNGDSSFIAEARPLSGWNEPIALRLWNLSADSYRFEARIDGMPDDGRRAFLEDRQLHTRTPLAMNGEITAVDFRIAAGEAAAAEDRFRIVYGREALNASPSTDNAGDARSLSVYPNPLTGRSFNVRLQQMPAGTYTLQLFSSEGRMVMNRQVEHEGGQAIFSMELSGALPKGSYRLRCLRGDVGVANEVLIVQ